MNSTDAAEHRSTIPIIGLGGSAGAIGALQEFFKAMPTDTGMVFVVVMHLSPEHESMLASLLQQDTTMPVIQVTERTAVQPNQVYVIPPGKILTSVVGHLALEDLSPERSDWVLPVRDLPSRLVQYFAQPTRNLLHLLNPMLRIEVRAALSGAEHGLGEAETLHVPIDTNGECRSVYLRVTASGDIAPDHFLVVFEQRELPADDVVHPKRSSEVDPSAQQLDREIERIKAHLRQTIEQFEVSEEELKASNEELQAMNEEMHAATEELETSRKELQLINEELITVNQELKAKVDELATANSDVHNLMAATAIATVFLDRALCITRFTPSAPGLFKSINTDLGRPLTDLEHLLDYPDMARDAQTVLDTLVPLEREAHTPDGTWYLARLRPYRTTENFIGGVVLTFVDISENKKTQQALETSRQQLLTALQETEQARAETEAAGAAKDHFLAVLSHELRTPLTPVLMATHALDKHPDFPDPLRHLLAMIQRNVNTETRFIDDLLDVTRIANGKLQVVRQPMDLHEAVQGALEISADDARRRKQKVILTLTATDTTISGDRERLQQALWNLIKNASKFSPPGSEIRVSSHSDESQIYVTVEDPGIGISSPDIPRIFDAYVQATLGVASQYGGLGLGLSIAHATVQAHGGSISARSDGEGRGATFVVALPLTV